jgi:nucleoid DNA-binding protein
LGRNLVISNDVAAGRGDVWTCHSVSARIKHLLMVKPLGIRLEDHGPENGSDGAFALQTHTLIRGLLGELARPYLVVEPGSVEARIFTVSRYMSRVIEMLRSQHRSREQAMTGLKSQPSTKPPKLNMMLIVADIHNRTEIPKEYVSAVLRGFKELVRDSMIAGVDIDMGPDFGKFVAIEVAGRKHYIPATGGTTQTSVRRKIRFRPGSRLRNLPPLREPEEASADDPDAEVASVEVGIAEVIEDFLEEPGPEPAPKLKWMRAREAEEEGGGGAASLEGGIGWAGYHH